MTETWMSGRGRQQDHDLYGGAGGAEADSHRQMRSSLGQLIERSISAPPASDSYEDSYGMRGVSFMIVCFYLCLGKVPSPVSYVRVMFLECLSFLFLDFLSTDNVV